ncbi:hypothetical protein QE364_001182 [Nocardioides zeae]|uniref:Uncharacterized protein n=1 Tax=Nocardioides zeae TaxID=1457234 RepID=A0ACC6IG55_9ACTN|nr:hypothetical protein [Nocardioides zeae]MDR6176470.1 hypothetical protein [Nocardioides zeae]MDR6209482.1 hypothetical protein [Nocardioides zeae]
MAEIPGFGTCTLDERLGWLVGDTRLEVPGLGVVGTVVIDDPEADLTEVAAVLRRLTGLPPQFRATLTPFLWAYYSDVAAEWRASDPLHRPEDVWSQVEIGDELHVVRHGDDWYVDIESSCDWEPEHGLQVVLRDGDTLTKIGPYDGHHRHLGTDEVYPDAGRADGPSARPGWWRRLRRAGAPRRR